MNFIKWDLLQIKGQGVIPDGFLLQFCTECVPKSRGCITFYTHTHTLTRSPSIKEITGNQCTIYQLLMSGSVSPGKHSGLGTGPPVLTVASFNTSLLDSASRFHSRVWGSPVAPEANKILISRYEERATLILKINLIH